LIIDTNALSAFIDGDQAVGKVLGRQSRAAVPVIVLGEFRYGIAASKHRKDYEQWIDVNLQHFELLSVIPETTLAYAQVRTSLKLLGRPIPANDAWIAALAIQHGLPVLSRDTHFDAVPGLRRTSW
jgi:tRNA(fMet)-specific endonuclease VapC